MSLMTSGVVQSMIGADFYMKTSETAMGIYQQAKAKGDNNVMKQALGYAGESMSSAAKLSKKAQQLLEKAQKENRKETEAEQKEALEKQRKEAAKDRNKPGKVAAVDTVKISKESQANNNDIKDTDSVHNNRVITRKGEIEGAIRDMVNQGIYTASGKIETVSTEQTLSVTV